MAALLALLSPTRFSSDITHFRVPAPSRARTVGLSYSDEDDADIANLEAQARSTALLQLPRLLLLLDLPPATTADVVPFAPPTSYSHPC